MLEEGEPMNRPALHDVLQVAGLSAITFAVFLWSLVGGVLMLGVSLLLLGVAKEMR